MIWQNFENFKGFDYLLRALNIVNLPWRILLDVRQIFGHFCKNNSDDQKGKNGQAIWLLLTYLLMAEIYLFSFNFFQPMYDAMVKESLYRITQSKNVFAQK